MLSLTPFHHPEVGGVCLVATDLTQQKVNEEIVASERLARSILEQVGEVIVVLDAKGKIIRASQETWNLAGQNPLYRAFDSIFPLTLTYPSGEKTGFSLASVVDGATYQNVMAELRLPDRVHYLLFSAVPMLKQESQDTPGVIITMVDITRQRQEELDQRFLAHLGQVIQSKDDPDEVIATSGDYFKASRTLFCEVHTDQDLCILCADYHPGLPPLAHENSLSSLGIEAVQELHSGQAVILQDAGSDPRTATLFSSSAWPENLRAYVAVPILQEGEWTAVLAVSSNRPGAWSRADIPLLQAVADRIWPAYEKLRLSVSLRTSEEAVRKYALDLEKSNQELKNFTSIISHDLQEPLRKVNAFGDQLKRKYASSLDEEGIDYIGRMQNASVRMQRMIDDLLTYSRLSTSERRFKPVDLHQVAREVLDDLETRLSQTGGSVELSGFPVIQGDEVQMRQLFLNIIGNALKFHKEGEAPRVKVWSRIPGNGQVEIYISDNGIGFSMDHLERIFQPFQRLHGRSEYEGNGIGLAICRKIIDRHNGHITAQSGPGEGTTFIITLPVHGLPSDEKDTRGDIPLA
jgi:signal transduction histidine kinase